MDTLPNMARAVKPRPYVSAQRTRQAEATRRRILDAALVLFTVDGYAATTIDQIAAAADVSVPTVYKAFRTKRAILEQLVDAVMAGDSKAGNLAEQEWFKEQLAAPDARRQLELVARNARRLYERSGSLLRVVRDAAASDADIAELWEQISRRRRQRSRTTARNLTSKPGRLRHHTDVVADILWTQTAPDLWHMLVRDARWTSERYERWLADALETLLLS
jgi:AcrR family transcriptional regulator